MMWPPPAPSLVTTKTSCISRLLSVAAALWAATCATRHSRKQTSNYINKTERIAVVKCVTGTANSKSGGRGSPLVAFHGYAARVMSDVAVELQADRSVADSDQGDLTRQPAEIDSTFSMQ